MTLIDTGPQMDEAIEALRSGLANLGHRFADIKRVIDSHAHVDHYGLARLIDEESGAEVCVHPWDAAALTGSDDYTAEGNLLRAAGVPEEAVVRMAGGYREFLSYGPRLDRATVLEDDEPNPVLNVDPVDSKRRFQSLGEYLGIGDRRAPWTMLWRKESWRFARTTAVTCMFRLRNQCSGLEIMVEADIYPFLSDF